MLIPNAPEVGQLSEGLGVVPEATYNLKVHKAEYIAIPKRKESKGPYIKAQLIITGPSDGVVKDANGNDVLTEAYVGRYVFMNYSLSGDGSFRLRELLEVTGHGTDFKLQDSDQLINLEFKALVTVQPGTPEYPDPKNNVKKHLPLL